MIGLGSGVNLSGPVELVNRRVLLLLKGLGEPSLDLFREYNGRIGRGDNRSLATLEGVVLRRGVEGGVAVVDQDPLCKELMAARDV